MAEYEDLEYLAILALLLDEKEIRRKKNRKRICNFTKRLGVLRKNTK